MRRSQSGFSLIELMVSMTIGLVVLGGVAASFDTNHKTASVKRGYDEAQDSLRFASNLLARVVRQASVVEAGSSSATLHLRFAGGAGVSDCIGQPTDDGASYANTLYFDEGQLWCETDDGLEIALAEGFRSIRFTYGTRDPSTGAVHDEDYLDELEEGVTYDVRSVRTAFQLTNGTRTAITTALRASALGL